MSHTVTPRPSAAVDVAVILTAIIRPEADAGGYSASIPALPGCHTQGETLDEVRANLREAAEGWLAVAHDDALARQAAGNSVKVISGKQMCRVLEQPLLQNRTLQKTRNNRLNGTRRARIIRITSLGT
jgi:predicted RNase H-like HicB family nuclease